MDYADIKIRFIGLHTGLLSRLKRTAVELRCKYCQVRRNSLTYKPYYAQRFFYALIH